MFENSSPHVTVIITAYDPERYEDINEAIDSILGCTYENKDVIVIVDGVESLAKRIRKQWKSNGAVTVLCNEMNLGAAESRNEAVKEAEGEIVAFFDDDAVADEKWLDELVRCYTEHGAVAAGGKIEPVWLYDEPAFLPEEFYWLIGATYKGYPEEMTYVRNTFASNLSFRKSVFEDIGGFNPDIGPKGESLLQSAETELCVRLQQETGEQILYNPDAVVGHKVYEFRSDPEFLLRRAFWQGVSKSGMKLYIESDLDTESDFLWTLLSVSVPERLKAILTSRRKQAAAQLLFLILGTAAVGFGYLWGLIKFRDAIDN